MTSPIINMARRFMRGSTAVCALCLWLWLSLFAGSANAQRQGFRIDRTPGTSAGSWLFTVERPWYMTTRWLAVGVTLGYTHNALRLPDPEGTAVVAHALGGSLDLAGSPFSWLSLRASLPVTFLERGQQDALSGAAPIDGAAVGDPRLGAMARLFGDADRDRFSLHFGIDGWAPTGGAAQQHHQGDIDGRLLPRLIVAGAFKQRGRYTVEAGYLYRPDAIIGTPGRAAIAGSEAQLGLALSLLTAERFHVGIELRFAARVTGLDLGRNDLFRLEALLGAQYLVAEQFLFGAALSTSAIATQPPGSPDLQFLLRAAWAPRRARDSDGDGIPDSRDRCPNEPEDHDGYRDDDGCPELSPNVVTVTVRPMTNTTTSTMPATPQAATPLPKAKLDSDGDGIPDAEDRCPLSPEDRDGFEDEDGCPDPDNDGDGIPDDRDRCPLEAETVNDQADDDGCPEVAGARVQITSNQLTIKEQVRFRPDKAIIDPRSYSLLREMAQVLRSHADYAIEIQGHTDNIGQAQKNLRLSQLRAEAVRTFLIKEGIAGERLRAKGYGVTQPLLSNKTAAGRAKNRRVEFWLLGGRK